MEVLNETFPGRWLGRGGSILWLPRSLDLTPLDFFFWGYVKKCGCMDQIRDPNHLKARTREATEQVTRDMLQCVWQKVGLRLDICRVTNNAHVGTH
jgi:hypothetical protein